MGCIIACYSLGGKLEDEMWQRGLLCALLVSFLFKRTSYSIGLLIGLFTLFQFQDIQPAQEQFKSAYCKIDQVKPSAYNTQLYCSCKSNNQAFKSVMYSKESHEFISGEVYFMKAGFKRHKNLNLKHEFSYSRYLKLQGIYYESRPEKSFYFKRIKKTDFFSKYQRQSLQWINKSLSDAFDKPTVSIILALCFGDKSQIEKETYQYFRKAGLMHIIAVSGLHVGLIQLVLLSVFRLVFGKRSSSIVWQQTAVVILLFGFAWLCQFSLSVVRSILMFSIIYYSILSKRIISPLHGMFLSAFIMLLWNPLQLFTVGFQFSYLATFGLLCYGKSIQILTGRIRLKVLGWFVQLSLISMVAQFFLLPLVFYYFGELPIWFLVFNIPGFVFVSLVLYLTMLFFIAVPISAFVSDRIAWVLELLIQSFDRLLRIVDYSNTIYVQYRLNSILEMVVLCVILFLMGHVFIYYKWKQSKYLLMCILFFGVLRELSVYKRRLVNEIVVWNTNVEQAITYKSLDTLVYYSSYHLPMSTRIINYSKALETLIKRELCLTTNDKYWSNLYQIRKPINDTIVCLSFVKSKDLEAYFINNYPDRVVMYWFFKDGYLQNLKKPDVFLNYGPTRIPDNYGVYFYP